MKYLITRFFRNGFVLFTLLCVIVAISFCGCGADKERQRREIEHQKAMRWADEIHEVFMQRDAAVKKAKDVKELQEVHKYYGTLIENTNKKYGR
jgi:cytochrome c biogenesis protein ResB